MAGKITYPARQSLEQGLNILDCVCLVRECKMSDDDVSDSDAPATRTAYQVAAADGLRMCEEHGAELSKRASCVSVRRDNTIRGLKKSGRYKIYKFIK